jgi:hypothetical protein
LSAIQNHDCLLDSVIELCQNAPYLAKVEVAFVFCNVIEAASVQSYHSFVENGIVFVFETLLQLDNDLVVSCVIRSILRFLTAGISPTEILTDGILTLIDEHSESDLVSPWLLSLAPFLEALSN